jgi:hypothetical protein
VTLGADRKKVGILAGLLAMAAYFFYVNVLSPPDDPPAAARAASSRTAPPGAAAGAARTPLTQPPARSGARVTSQEFRPSLKARKPGEGPEPVAVDPTLRLDLLAKVQAVKFEGGERNLFQFGAAPLPKTPEPKIIPKPAGPAAAENKPAETPGKPPPPPIPLKFYGYASQTRPNQKRAFFLEGDEIIMATEGELIKKRYKVVRIGINSVVVEDIEHKNQQTLPLEEQTG